MILSNYESYLLSQIVRVLVYNCFICHCVVDFEGMKYQTQSLMSRDYIFYDNYIGSVDLFLERYDHRYVDLSARLYYETTVMGS